MAAANPQPAPEPQKRPSLRLTPQQSDLMDRRIRELSGQDMPCGQIQATLNAEFGLTWGLGAYWKRAKRNSIKLPPRHNRLTLEQYQRMDQRIAELRAQGKRPADIQAILNPEFGLNWRVETYRRPLRMHRDPHSKGWKYLPAEHKHNGCNGIMRISTSWPLEIDGIAGEDVLKVTIRCSVCRSQSYWILPDGVEAKRVGEGRNSHTYYEFPREGKILRTAARHAAASAKQRAETKLRNATAAFKRRVDLYGEDIAGKWDSLTKSEKQEAIWASLTPEQKSKWTNNISNGLSQPDVRKVISIKSAASWSERNARTLPADLSSKPDSWQKIVPVLIADRAAGGNISNLEILKMFGLKISTETMNDIRRYCGVRGPKGRVPKKL